MFQAKGVVCQNCAPIYRRKSNTAVVGRSDMKIEYSEKSEQRFRSPNYSTDMLKFVLKYEVKMVKLLHI